MDDRDVDELHRIWELKEKGAISEDEYARLKAKILENHPDTSGGPAREYQAAASASPIASASPSTNNTPSNLEKYIMHLFERRRSTLLEHHQTRECSQSPR